MAYFLGAALFGAAAALAYTGDTVTAAVLLGCNVVAFILCDK